MAASEAQKRASMKYDRANKVQIKFAVNKKTEADILDKLKSVENKQGYIKSLIRKDLKLS